MTALQIHIDLLDKMGVFTLRAAPNTICSNISSSQIDAEVGTGWYSIQLVHEKTSRDTV